MINKEIKEVLECCIGDEEGKNCFDCPLYEIDDCQKVMCQDSLDLIKHHHEEYEHLLKIARKMHTWIFLNTGDEQAVYDEIGLSDEDNMLLGYGGKIELAVGEEENNT